MTEKIITLIEKGDYKIPYILFKNYKTLGLNEKDLVVLIHLINEPPVFNPKQMSEELMMPLPEVMMEIDMLCSKEFISLEMKETQVKEEYISLSPLYKKLAYFTTSSEIPKEEAKINIYDLFEKEFSRTLSPMEYEIITTWLNSGYTEELINLALKEAVYNGALNLRYVDKVLFEWKKKGIHDKTTYDKNKEQFQNSKKEIRPKKELLDYDWLNES
jgi:DNA replication protein